MRILHLDAGEEMRGGQWQVLRLAGATTGTLLARHGSPLFRKAAETGIDVRPLNLPALARLAREADLLHAHDARSHALAVLTARCPVVVSRRVAFPLRRGPLSRWKYGRAAHYIAVSEYVKNILAGCGVPAARISVVYDGVPLLERAMQGEAIVAPATRDAMKGADLVSQAAKLAGVTVRFATDLEAGLGGAALFVYISRSEGLGSAILLAMSAGVPVIASKTGGIPEVIRHEHNGLLVENTAESIAAAMRRLLENPDLAHLFSTRSRQLIEERFSVEHMVRDTIAVYERVLSC